MGETSRRNRTWRRSPPPKANRSPKSALSPGEPRITVFPTVPRRSSPVCLKAGKGDLGAKQDPLQHQAAGLPRLRARALR